MNIYKYINNPFKYIVLALNSYSLLKWVPDKLALKLIYRAHTGKALNLKCPREFNEKLQWLKLNNRKEEYTQMVDKYEVKKYVKDILGEEYVIPTLGVWDSFDDIEFDDLPMQFVLKTTHDSGGVLICKNKENFDYEAAKEKMSKWLKRNYYLRNREWPYKGVKSRIMAEKYLGNDNNTDLIDYKIFNFHGTPKLIQLDYNRFSAHGRSLYSIEWEKLNIDYKYFNDLKRIDKRPYELEEILTCAKVLSANIPFLRTDFYIHEGQVYFGELTFFPESGFGKFSNEEFGRKLGDLIDISNI